MMRISRTEAMIGIVVGTALVATADRLAGIGGWTLVALGAVAAAAGWFLFDDRERVDTCDEVRFALTMVTAALITVAREADRHAGDHPACQELADRAVCEVANANRLLRQLGDPRPEVGPHGTDNG